MASIRSAIDLLEYIRAFANDKDSIIPYLDINETTTHVRTLGMVSCSKEVHLSEMQNMFDIYTAIVLLIKNIKSKNIYTYIANHGLKSGVHDEMQYFVLPIPFKNKNGELFALQFDCDFSPKGHSLVITKSYEEI
jgi:hypothetical protein